MSDPKITAAVVGISYVASDGYESEQVCTSKVGTKEGPPHGALLTGIEELARLCALFGFEKQAREAVEQAFLRVREFRNPGEAQEFEKLEVLASALDLTEKASKAGVVVTIERIPLKPLAMGHAAYAISTRPLRGGA